MGKQLFGRVLVGYSQGTVKVQSLSEIAHWPFLFRLHSHDHPQTHSQHPKTIAMQPQCIITTQITNLSNLRGHNNTKTHQSPTEESQKLQETLGQRVVKAFAESCRCLFVASMFCDLNTSFTLLLNQLLFVRRSQLLATCFRSKRRKTISASSFAQREDKSNEII